MKLDNGLKIMSIDATDLFQYDPDKHKVVPSNLSSFYDYVDENGLMTILSTGETTITAYWNDTSCSTVITVTNGEDSGDSGTTDTPTVTMVISGNKNLKVGFSRTYTVTYTDANSNDISANYTTVWSLASDDFDISEISVTENGNEISLLCKNEDLVDYTITLTASDADGLFTPASIEITVIEMF